MTGIDRRETGGEQRDEGGLRPLQTKRHLVIALGGDLLEIAVPSLTGVDAELLARLAAEQIPGALDVFGREGFAVVPFDALAQPERQLGLVLVP